jgi:hypothetical protein
MSIWNWFMRLRKARDDAAMRRAEAEAVETPEERTVTSGDIDAIRADERAAELTRDTPAESEHLGE